MDGIGEWRVKSGIRRYVTDVRVAGVTWGTRVLSFWPSLREGGVFCDMSIILRRRWHLHSYQNLGLEESYIQFPSVLTRP